MDSFSLISTSTPHLKRCVCASGRVLSPSPSSPQKSSVIIFYMVDKSFFLILNLIMDQFMLYAPLIIASIALILCLYACVRVGQFINASKGLDWDAVANITGDLATTKKTIQTLNNRLNGMHSPKLADQELMMQLMQRQPNQQMNGQIKNVGG